MMHNTEPEVQPPLQLLNVVRALVTAMRLRGPDLEAVARRIETYDNQPYPLTYVIMSNYVTNLLRALAAAERNESAPVVPVRPRIQYGPALRDPSRG